MAQAEAPRSSVFRLQEAAYLNTVGLYNLMQAACIDNRNRGTTENREVLGHVMVPLCRTQIEVPLEVQHGTPDDLPARTAIHLALEAFHRSLTMLATLSAETLAYGAAVDEHNRNFGTNTAHTLFTPHHVLQSAQLPPSRLSEAPSNFFILNRAQLFHFPESDPIMKQMLQATTTPSIGSSPLAFYAAMVAFNIALGNHQLFLLRSAGQQAPLALSQQCYQDCLLVLNTVSLRDNASQNDMAAMNRMKLAALNNLAHTYLIQEEYGQASSILELAAQMAPLVLIQDRLFPPPWPHASLPAKDIDQILLNTFIGVGRPFTAAAA